MSDLYALPDGWEWKKLIDQEVCQLVMGQSPKSDTYNTDGDGMPFFQGKTEFGKTYPTVSKYCTKPKKIAEVGDILLSVRAPVGPTNIANIQCCIGRGLGAVRPNKDNTLTNFLLYFFRNFEVAISQKGKGSTFSAITKKELENTDIPLPPLQEQKRIVSKLDTLFEKIDKAIALHQTNMDEADAFMGSVLNEVFGELEERYGLIKINDTVIKTKNRNPKDDQDRPFTYIDISSIDNKSFKIIEPKQLIGSEAPSRAKKEILLGDVVYSTTRPNLKNIAIVNEKYDNPIASTGLCVLRVNNKTINSYLFYYLLTEKLFEQIEPNIRGAQYPATSDKDLKNCNIPNTPYLIQQKVVEYLDQISEKTEKVKQVQKEKMESLKALKASLLDQAFRGEL